VPVDEDDGGNRENVIDLVEALRRSVRGNQAKPDPTPAKKAAAKPAKRPAKRAGAK
jgi:non-homologous end joining protein Ku